ncbi:MAG: AAA family ATPase [Bacillota bacterium]
MRQLRDYQMEIVAGIVSALIVFSTLRGYMPWPALVLFGLISALTQTTGLRTLTRRFSSEVGKLAKVGTAGTAPVTFDSIGGQQMAKRELMEALEFIKSADRVRSMGIRPIKGVLLAGPPGTGKTLLAKAAANYIDSAFVATSGSEFVEIYAGVGAQRVRELFRQARQEATRAGKRSAVVFIDELEVLGGTRGRHESHLEYDQTINQLLIEMDGLRFDDDIHVLVIGATNRPDLLDPALLRPGRFDRVVRVSLPDKNGRLEILRIHAANKPLAPDVRLEEIARETYGFSGAHLESLCNEAAILALREGCPVVHHRHFKEAVDKVMLGEKLDRKPSPEELRRVCVHEAGHAIVTELLKPGSVAMVSVVPRGGALGYVRHEPDNDPYLLPQSAIEREVAILLAGSVAEQLFFTERSTGSTNDFNQAVALCRKMVFSGMSSLGIVDYDSVGADAVNKAVHEILRAQESRARSLLRCRWVTLLRAAQLLLERETIFGDELRQLLGRPLPSRKWRDRVRCFSRVQLLDSLSRSDTVKSS